VLPAVLKAATQDLCERRSAIQAPQHTNCLYRSFTPALCASRQHMCVYVQTIWPRADERMLVALRRRHIGFTDARKGGVGCRPPASGLSRRSAVGLSCCAAECCRLYLTPILGPVSRPQNNGGSKS
jgi:hypothetical protein